MMSLVGKERVKGKNLIPLHQYILHVLEACIPKRHFWKYGIRGENLSVTFWHDIHYGGKKVELGHIIGQAVIGQHEDGSRTQACITMQMRLYHKDFRFLSWILGLQFPEPPPPKQKKFLLVRVLDQKTYVISTKTFGLVWTRKQCRIELWYFVNRMNVVTSLF